MLLLDTNVVSELRKVGSVHADTIFTGWAKSAHPADLYISAVTVAELEIGVRLVERRDARQGAPLRTWLENHVLLAFDGRILPIDTSVARRSAELHVPDPQPINDAFIAATALVHELTLVTRNVRVFDRSRVAVLNPWVKT